MATPTYGTGHEKRLRKLLDRFSGLAPGSKAADQAADLEESPMAAYVIVEIEIEDKERYAEYVKVVPPTIARYGGTYLARGGRMDVLEGTWQPKRLVILRFDSVERARAWWESDDYAAPKALRQACSIGNMVVVEGVAEPVS
ncbi:MAG TPA: DUF1330 domain-containing protein [Vicinamibacteria bacterium]|nr:DUF1330 domain-containing protein [Vicinamibacteria bacterium]